MVLKQYHADCHWLLASYLNIIAAHSRNPSAEAGSQLDCFQIQPPANLEYGMRIMQFPVLVSLVDAQTSVLLLARTFLENFELLPIALDLLFEALVTICSVGASVTLL